MSVVPTPRRAGQWILFWVVINGLATVAFAVCHIFWLSVILLAASGLGNSTSSIMRGTVNQIITPDKLRGRVSAVSSIFTNNGPQLGQVESGVAAAWRPIRGH